MKAMIIYPFIVDLVSREMFVYTQQSLHRQKSDTRSNLITASLREPLKVPSQK